MWETAGMVRWNENEEREDGGGDSERRLLVRARTTGAGRGRPGGGLSDKWRRDGGDRPARTGAGSDAVRAGSRGRRCGSRCGAAGSL